MKITFSTPHSAFYVKAPKDTMVCLFEEPTTVKDGVYVIGDEGAISIDEGWQADAIYLSTTGTDYTVADGQKVAHPAEGVEIRASLSAVPFKVSGKGGGGSGGDNTHYKGTTTTAIANGSTTNPITIDGEEYTAVFGDIVVYNYTEFVFDGTTWSEFGRPFDTTPTSGSANAVTSDGIYQKTVGAGRFGMYGTCYDFGGRNSQSGSDCYVYMLGQHLQVRNTGKYSLQEMNGQVVVGRYNKVNNNYAYCFPFIVGNGTSDNNRSNILEVGEELLNVNGDIQKNGVSLPTPYTTMPTITEAMLGQIAMYVGETTNDYVKGYFYIASSDGAAEPTYSWVNLPVSPRTYSETVLWANDSTTNPSTISLSSAYTNYDEIIIVEKHISTNDTYTSTAKYLVSAMALNDMIGISLGDAPSLYTWYKLTAANELTISVSGLLLNKIIGIKY